MKVLGISGSPRNGSTTDQLVREVLAGIEGCETEFISLSGKTIKPCGACLGCVKTNVCAVKDDMAPMREKIVGADAYVIGGPTYFNRLNSLTHAFMERWFQFRHREAMVVSGRLGIAVGVGGGNAKPAATAIGEFFHYNGVECVGDVTAQGAACCYTCGCGETCGVGAVRARHPEGTKITDEIIPSLCKQPVAMAEARAPGSAAWRAAVTSGGELTNAGRHLRRNGMMAIAVLAILAQILPALAMGVPATDSEAARIMARVREYPFNPIVDGRSQEPALDHDGVANLTDDAWRVRLLAIRDLARLGEPTISPTIGMLRDDNPHVRHVAAFTLGLRPSEQAAAALVEVLGTDGDPVVRSQLAISLGQLNHKPALPLLKDLAEHDPSRDVRHQCDLAIYRLTKYEGPEANLAAAYAKLDESTFEQIRVGRPAIDFELADTDGKPWRLSDFRGKKDVVLIWIFADWCPVCHNEFRELIELREKYEAENVEVVTIECHDPYRCRVMAGREFQPEYWFTKQSPQGSHEGKIWWQHLVDVAGAVGATYGVQPMEFVVHAEWINRPATVIVDREGIVRFAYYGTFWGDRATIEQTLEMIAKRDFAYEHPKRLKATVSTPSE